MPQRRDFLSKAERSRRMSLIRSKDTAPERVFARMLRSARLRFRRHQKTLPGCPDFSLVDHQAVVFVDGDFWHGRHFGSWSHKLRGYWLEKISRNMRRDRRVRAKLRQLGWKVARVWETDLARNPDRVLSRIQAALTKPAWERLRPCL